MPLVQYDLYPLQGCPELGRAQIMGEALSLKLLIVENSLHQHTQ